MSSIQVSAYYEGAEFAECVWLGRTEKKKEFFVVRWCLGTDHDSRGMLRRPCSARLMKEEDEGDLVRIGISWI